MRDFQTLPEALERKARKRDPEAWRSADSQGEAFDLRYRRERARDAIRPAPPSQSKEPAQ